MLRKHRDLLQVNDYYLLTHLEIVDEPEFLQVLSNILLPNHIDELNRLNSNKEKVKKFLEILPRRGSKAFDLFMDALLRSDQSYIHDKLSLCLDHKLLASFKNREESYDSIDSCIDNRNLSDSKRIILMINNISFKDKNLDRAGSENDILGLERYFVQTLKYILYNEKSYQDQEASEIVEIIREFTLHIASNNINLAVVVLMSHGKNNAISGSDDEMIEIQQILKILSKDTDHIFKLVILSCCRGGTASISNSDVNSVGEMLLQSRYYEFLRYYKHFTPKNSIVLYSTQLEYESYRDSSGTIFIQSMLSVFEKNYKDKSIRDMVIKIRPEMRVKYPRYDQFPDIKENYCNDFYL